ncbi:MAG: excinuclease ABC subunit B, partial [Deltaproteobacteria bacterium]|nr:excinuclease ABC subunit B [Deltaproteobacteria bacterium]
EQAYRIEWFGDEIEKISVIDPLRGQTIRDIDKISLFPTSHYVVTPQDKERAINSIRDELRERLQELRKNERVLESQRLEQRTMYDLEMIEEMGYCNGIENYSRHLTGRRPGQSPPTLLDYFPDEFLLIVDESHQTIPQIGAMYRGDQSRKTTLVEHGFRLPSALDNRPLQFDEFMKLRDRMLYVSATPGNFELERCEGVVTEQIIRPTGLLDPPVEIRPAKHQVDDLLEEIRVCVENGQRVLVTTLTKRMSEDLTEFYADSGVRVRYLHSDIDTLERIELIKGLRLGEYDVLVGINLLREGLDIPEVALVAILDADKEGFLRSDRALIQTMGRAARNVEGRIILYADKMTRSMNSAMDETSRRRTIQEAFNTEHNITPTSVTREIRDFKAGDDFAQKAKKHDSNEHFEVDSIPAEIVKLKAEMKKAAQALEFEEAASLRDRIRTLENLLLKLG